VPVGWVKAGDAPLEGGDPLHRLGEAVRAQAVTLEASVAGGAEHSVLVCVEGRDVADAGEVVQRVVGAGSSGSAVLVGWWR
jgi:hypothetical protein